MKNLEDKTVSTTANQAYVKPKMEMYEMEMEGALMDNTSGVNSSYEETDDYNW